MRVHGFELVLKIFDVPLFPFAKSPLPADPLAGEIALNHSS